jgi:hypothetical protein
VEWFLTLAEAQKFAGNPGEARTAVQVALKMLSLHGEGVEAATERVRGVKLLQSLPAGPGDSASHQAR